MKPIEDLTDELTAYCSVPQLVATLAANDIDATALGIAGNSIDMAQMVADGMLNGLAGDCRACGMPARRPRPACAARSTAVRPDGTSFSDAEPVPTWRCTCTRW